MCVICSHQPRPNSHHNMIMTRFTVHWIQPLQHTPTTRTTVPYVACRANAGSMMGQRKRWSIIKPALAHHWTGVGMGTTSIYNWSQAWIVRIIPILCGKNTWQPWTYVSPSILPPNLNNWMMPVIGWWSRHVTGWVTLPLVRVEYHTWFYIFH